ncbi:MAG: hypothetical protein ACRDD3_07215 [Azovibrio sp.]
MNGLEMPLGPGGWGIGKLSTLCILLFQSAGVWAACSDYSPVTGTDVLCADIISTPVIAQTGSIQAAASYSTELDRGRRQSSSINLVGRWDW